MALHTNEEERFIAEVQGHRQQHIAHPGVGLYGRWGGGTVIIWLSSKCSEDVGLREGDRNQNKKTKTGR